MLKMLSVICFDVEKVLKYCRMLNFLIICM